MKQYVLPLLMTTLLLTGCSGKGVNPDYSDNSKMKIRFHVDAKSTEGIAYKKLVDAFNKEYASQGMKVTPSFVARSAGDSEYEKQLNTDKLEGTLPDIITFDAPNCAAYAEAEYLYDISSYLSAEEKAKYITLNSYQGKTYGIPIQESPPSRG